MPCPALPVHCRVTHAIATGVVREAQIGLREQYGRKSQLIPAAA
jgi:hypothetical protein